MRKKTILSWSVLILLNIFMTFTLYMFFKSDLISLTKGSNKNNIFTAALVSATFANLLIWILGIVTTLISPLSLKPLRYVVYTFKSLMISTLFFVLFIDVQTFITTGMHIYSPYVIGNLVQKNIFNELNFEINTLLSFFLFFVTVSGINIVLLFLLIKFQDKSKLLKHISQLLFFVLSFSFVGISVFFVIKGNEISKDEGNETIPFFNGTYSFFYEKSATDIIKLNVYYPYKKFADVKLSEKPDILMIFVESLRYDVFNEENMPLIYNFSKGNCITSHNHHSGELSTIYSTFAFLYGLNIHYYYPFYFSKTRSVPIQILKNNGYLTIGAAASNLKDMSVHSAVLYDQFDKYREFFDKDWKKDRHMIDWIKKLDSDKNETRSKFYFTFFQSTHHNYYYPPEFEKYTPVIEKDFNYFKGSSLKERKNEVKNRYLNAVRYVDSLIFELLNHFKDKIEAGEMIIAIAGDHGEEFWDTGILGHGKISNNFRSRVPFMICSDGIDRKEVELSSHVDIFPTIIKYLNPEADVNKWSDGISLLGEIPQNRYITVSGFDFPRRSQEVTLINRKGKLFLKKTTDSVNKKNFFKILKKTDLNDKPDQNLSNELDGMIDRFSNDMNRFFR